MRKVKYIKASFGKRLFAFLLDNVLILLVIYLPLLFLIETDSRWYNRLLQEGLWLVYMTYMIAFETSALQGSIGKKILDLKVIKTNGKRPGFWDALTRNVGKQLIQLTFGQGIFRLLIPGQRQAIHDEVATCYVVERKPLYSVRPTKNA